MLVVIDAPRRASSRRATRRSWPSSAQLASVAIDNARLYEERSYIARTLQRSLLPPRLPEIPGVETAARYRAAGEGIEVGGDFYDVFETIDAALRRRGRRRERQGREGGGDHLARPPHAARGCDARAPALRGSADAQRGAAPPGARHRLLHRRLRAPASHAQRGGGDAARQRRPPAAAAACARRATSNRSAASGTLLGVDLDPRLSDIARRRCRRATRSCSTPTG